MRAEATVEVLCLLSDFEDRFRWLTYSRSAVLPFALIPTSEGRAIGGCRLGVRRYREGTLERRWRRPRSPCSLKRRSAESSGMKTSGYQSIVCAGKGGLTKTNSRRLPHGGYGGG